MELPDFASVRVLCLGDLMVDRFVNGRVERISPEGPVPIIRIDATHSVPGGAANVGRNISALGGRCTLVGVIGGDAAGGELGEMLSACGRIEPVLVTDAPRPTIEKIRFVANGQTLLRADREEPGEVSALGAQALVEIVRERVADHDVLVLSDYAKGVLTDDVIGAVIAVAASAAVPVVVDPKSVSLSRYAGATVITPNAKEAGLTTGIDVRTDEDAARAAKNVLSAADVKAILLTRSEQGMTLVTRDGDIVHVPTSAREVFDVVGAGDTVVAALALCLGAGMALEPAARIANIAAGVVVGKHGTATMTRSELVEELARLGRTEASSNRKAMARSQVAIVRQQWERDGLVVGFTNGCFDILHAGHVGILEFARSHCDRLIVAVNDDASVARLKGPARPVNGEDDRARVLAAIGSVDAVVLFAEDTPYALIDELQPDVLVKGADYAIEEIVGADIVQRRGGKVVTFDLVPGRSTTGIIARGAQRAALAS